MLTPTRNLDSYLTNVLRLTHSHIMRIKNERRFNFIFAKNYQRVEYTLQLWCSKEKYRYVLCTGFADSVGISCRYWFEGVSELLSWKWTENACILCVVALQMTRCSYLYVSACITMVRVYIQSITARRGCRGCSDVRTDNARECIREVRKYYRSHASRGLREGIVKKENCLTEATDKASLGIRR